LSFIRFVIFANEKDFEKITNLMNDNSLILENSELNLLLKNI